MGTSTPSAAAVAGSLARGLCALALVCAFSAGAIAAPAGEDVDNTASVTWIEGGTPTGPVFATATFLIDERIDVSVVLQTAGPVPTTPGATGEVLTFLVTNIGNGVEAFRLVDDPALAGDDFDPIPAGIFLDANGNGSYDAGVDLAYSPGVNDPTLDANTPGSESVVVFVLNDMPSAPAPAPGETGDVELTAQSLTLTGAPGTTLLGAGDGGTTAILGSSGGDDEDIGTYVIDSTVVEITKSATVDDGFGGSIPAPGSTITYSLAVSVLGSQTAANIVITDSIPTNTTYTNNTLTFNGTPLTDPGGDDAGDFNVTNPNAITVDVGDLDSSNPPQTITFQVTID